MSEIHQMVSMTMMLACFICIFGGAYQRTNYGLAAMISLVLELPNNPLKVHQ
jgi:hypothetical protein